MIGLPMALAIEDEARVIAQEKEMMGQQQGQAGVSNEMFPFLGRDGQLVMEDGGAAKEEGRQGRVSSRTRS